MWSVSINDSFSAAHFLREYPGDCANLHGHNFDVELCVSSQELDKLGMVVDFKILKSELKSIMKELDHNCLNNIKFFKEHNPTAENLSFYIFKKFTELFKASQPHICISYVKVFESGKAWAMYTQTS